MGRKKARMQKKKEKTEKTDLLFQVERLFMEQQG